MTLSQDIFIIIQLFIRISVYQLKQKLQQKRKTMKNKKNINIIVWVVMNYYYTILSFLTGEQLHNINFASTECLSNIPETQQKLLRSSKQRSDSLPLTAGFCHSSILLEENHHDSAETHTHQKHQEGCTQTKGEESYLIHKQLKCRKTRFSDVLRPGSSMQPTLKDLLCLPGRDTAAATGTHQTGSSCYGWLMSVDIYCHWVGCCILQGTAAFPIGQLYLNGQQTHNEAQGRRNGYTVLVTAKSVFSLGIVSL